MTITLKYAIVFGNQRKDMTRPGKIVGYCRFIQHLLNGEGTFERTNTSRCFFMINTYRKAVASLSVLCVVIGANSSFCASDSITGIQTSPIPTFVIKL